MLAVIMQPEVEEKLRVMYERYNVLFKMAILSGLNGGETEPLCFGCFINHLIARGMILETITYDEIEKGLTYVKDPNNGGA